MEKISGSNKCLQILTGDVFDMLYSVNFFLEDVSLTIRKELIQMLVTGLKNLINLMDRTKIIHWASLNFISSDTMHQMVREDSQFRLAI